MNRDKSACVKYKKREHVKYFDYLRFIGVFMVVYLHVSSPLVGGEISSDIVSRSVLIIFSTICFTAVPLFFMMSGYLILSDSKTEKISILLKHRLLHLIGPLFFWTVIVTFWVMWKNHDSSVVSFLKYVLSSFSTPIMQHFWYVYTLIAIYLISPILFIAINHIDEQVKKYVIYLIGFIFLQSMVSAVITIMFPENVEKMMVIKPIKDLRFLGGHLCTFILGYFLGNIKRRIPNYILFIIAGLDLIVISGFTIFATVQTGYIGVMQDQSAGFTVLLAICVFLLFKQNIADRERKINITPFVKMSFGIYMLHNLINRVFSYLGWDVFNIKSVLLKVIAIIIVSYIIIKTLGTCKLTCFLATGLPYSEGNKIFNWKYTFHNVFSKKNRKD